MYLPSSSCGVEADRNQSHPSWQNKIVYGTIDPGRPPQLLGEVLILVQIMGIVHYLFIAGQEYKMPIWPWPEKNTECLFVPLQRI